jgi:hypothetical protein
MDERLHRGGELVARRQRDLAVVGDPRPLGHAVVGDPRPLGQAVERLLDDPHRLLHLGQADREAVEVVALRADRDAELEVLVARVRHRLAQVPRVAGRAQQRAGDAERQQRLLVERARPAQPAQHDLVAVEQVAVLVDAVGHVHAELADLGLEPERDVLEDAADLDVARVHALARGHLEQVEDLLALAEAVPEHRDRAEVERARAQPHQVAHDPVELEVDDAQVLRALGHLEVEQRLDRPAERHRVEVVREVVHPLDDRDGLPVALVLGRLLDARVDVADDRLEVAHDLALERHQQAQHPVRRGVVRAHVEREQLLLGAVGLDWVLADGEVDALLLAAVLGQLGAHWV